VEGGWLPNSYRCLNVEAVIGSRLQEREHGGWWRIPIRFPPPPPHRLVGPGLGGEGDVWGGLFWLSASDWVAEPIGKPRRDGMGRSCRFPLDARATFSPQVCLPQNIKAVAVTEVEILGFVEADSCKAPKRFF